jgi:sorbitol-specific phosphotransferase system component IIBC
MSDAQMRGADMIVDTRALGDAEIETVSGGHPAILLAGVTLGALAFIGIGWGDLPVGMSKEQAAQKVGLGHLL